MFHLLFPIITFNTFWDFFAPLTAILRDFSILENVKKRSKNVLQCKNPGFLQSTPFFAAKIAHFLPQNKTSISPPILMSIV